MGSELPDLEDVACMSSLRASLLSWYGQNHRTLPWRRTPPNAVGEAAVAATEQHSWSTAAADVAASRSLSASDFAYGVWVSETMSQQTQVSRVATYFVTWVHRWPTLAALAAAQEDEVHALWAGLGYYRRARFLLQGAKHAHANGGLPTAQAGLLSVPGIGPYTAASVASIAFGEPVACVDANVVRVISRLRAVRAEAPGSAAAARQIQALAQQLLDPSRPGDWNQAVMELGATVCKPRSPDCASCPVSSHCEARRIESAGGEAASSFPAPKAAATKKSVFGDVRVLIWRDGAHDDAAQSLVLLHRRKDTGVLAGLWECPTSYTGGDGSGVDSNAADALLEPLQLPSQGFVAAGVVTHIMSHEKHTLSVRVAHMSGSGAPPPLPSASWKWAPASAKDLSSGQRKLLALALAPKGAAGKGRKRAAEAA